MQDKTIKVNNPIKFELYKALIHSCNKVSEVEMLKIKNNVDLIYDFLLSYRIIEEIDNGDNYIP